MEGKKFLLLNTSVKKVKWPRYDEISCKNLWSEYSGREDAMKLFPDHIPKGRQINREYFFNILNTIYNEEMTAIREHA